MNHKQESILIAYVKSELEVTRNIGGRSEKENKSLDEMIEILEAPENPDIISTPDKL